LFAHMGVSISLASAFALFESEEASLMSIAPLVPAPKELARRARLRYTCDEDSGMRRVVRGRGVVFEDWQGRVVRNTTVLKRIAALGIPPAWTDVWICPEPRGHLQATGRDARGRKQYIYHPDWHLHTSKTKYRKLQAFGLVLPKLRQQMRRHLALPGLPRRKVVAAVIALLDGTLIRVGNEEYAKANGSYGLTTLRDQHAKIEGQVIRLRFKGKSGKVRQIDFYDKRLARIVRDCQDLPGQQLFQYEDGEGRLHRVESADVNRYLRKWTGSDFTAKDFRTWKATTLALEKLSQAAIEPLSTAAAKAHLMQAYREAAEALGNTVTVCRKYYVHPAIVELFLEGRLAAACGRADRREGTRLQLYERVLLRILKRLETTKRQA
jgi:DNA topoisomerase I